MQRELLRVRQLANSSFYLNVITNKKEVIKVTVTFFNCNFVPFSQCYPLYTLPEIMMGGSII
jgi:hypothetical protein